MLNFSVVYISMFRREFNWRQMKGAFFQDLLKWDKKRNFGYSRPSVSTVGRKLMAWIRKILSPPMKMIEANDSYKMNA